MRQPNVLICCHVALKILFDGVGDLFILHKANHPARIKDKQAVHYFRLSHYKFLLCVQTLPMAERKFRGRASPSSSHNREQFNPSQISAISQFHIWMEQELLELSNHLDAHSGTLKFRCKNTFDYDDVPGHLDVGRTRWQAVCDARLSRCTCVVVRAFFLRFVEASTRGYQNLGRVPLVVIPTTHVLHSWRVSH
jgi:hypothetical protein